MLVYICCATGNTSSMFCKQIQKASSREQIYVEEIHELGTHLEDALRENDLVLACGVSIHHLHIILPISFSYYLTFVPVLKTPYSCSFTSSVSTYLLLQVIAIIKAAPFQCHIGVKS